MIRQRVYVAYDESDRALYQTMKQWENDEEFEYSFYDAQSLSSPAYKSLTKEAALTKVLKGACAFMVIVGQDTRMMKGLLEEEISIALSHNLPIICANANQSERRDDLCPAILNDKLCLFVAYEPNSIYRSLIYWPHDHRELKKSGKSTAYYY